jgi:hypothetical protein
MLLLSIDGKRIECKSFKSQFFPVNHYYLARNRILSPSRMVLW